MWRLLKALPSMCTSSVCAAYLVGGTAQSHLWAWLQKPCIPCPLHGFACLRLQPSQWMQKINATQNKLQMWIASSRPMQEHFRHAPTAGLEQARPVTLLWDWMGLQSMRPYKSTPELLVLKRITHNKAEASGNTTKLTTDWGQALSVLKSKFFPKISSVMSESLICNPEADFPH